MPKHTLPQIVAESFALEAEEAAQNDMVGYMGRVLIQATMPHKKQEGCEHVRENGDFRLRMFASPDVGLPYGAKPRLILSWLTTEALRRKERTLILGDSLSEFMGKLGFTALTGGAKGTINPFKDQLQRLFTTAIQCTYSNDDIGIAGRGMFIASKYFLWWDVRNDSQRSLWQSSVVLSEEFFEEVVSKPVPIDVNALRMLRGSAMALDIYCWLTFRMSYLRRQTEIPWGALQLQFGADYTRPRSFKEKFLHHLKQVRAVYRQANVSEGTYGIILRPSACHVPKRKPGIAQQKP